MKASVSPITRRVALSGVAVAATTGAVIASDVALMWHAITLDPARADGARSPHKAIIEDIDPAPKPVFFDEGLESVKKQMAEADPYTKVFFVDVVVSHAKGGKVAAYKVTAYHGEDSLEG